MKRSARFFVGLAFCSLFLLNICSGMPQGARDDLGAAEEGPPAFPAVSVAAPASSETTPPAINVGEAQTGERPSNLPRGRARPIRSGGFSLLRTGAEGMP